MEDNSEGSNIDRKYDDPDKRSALSKEDLDKAENSKDLYKPDNNEQEEKSSIFDRGQDKKGKSQKIGGLLKSRRSKIIGGAGLGGGIVGIIIAAFMALIPLKIEHIISNLQNRFMSTSNNAISKETDSLFSRYITERVLPSYTKCGSTISKSCSARIVGNKNNPVSNLFDSWGNARLENRLASKYGIEFQYIKKGANAPTWKISTNNTGLSTGGKCTTLCEIGENGAGLKQIMESSSKSDIRQAIKASLDDALSKETKWKQVYTRYKVGRLLEEKYGIRRCLFFCGITDPINDKIATQKKAFQAMLIKKVILPRSTILANSVSCLVGAGSSSVCDLKPKESGDPSTPATNGAPSSDFENTVTSNLNSEADSLASKTVDDMVKEAANVESKGLTKWLDEIVAPLIDKIAKNNALDAVPVVGEINAFNQAVQIGNQINNSSGLLVKIKYITVAASAVQLFSMYQTYSSEIHTGKITPTEVGSMVGSLSPGDRGTKNIPQVGGVAGAEGTPLYQHYINGVSTSQATAMASSYNLASLFIPSTLAATASGSSTKSSSAYKCQDGNSIQAGKLICPEENLTSGVGLAMGIKKFFDDSGLSVAITVWNDSIGAIFKGVNWVIGTVLGPLISVGVKAVDKTCSVTGVNIVVPVCPPYNELKKLAPVMLSGLINFLIPSPISNNMSGGRIFDMMSLGADVSGNDASHNILGGELLSPKQVAQIYNEEQNKAIKTESTKPIFARLFDTSSDYSLISKIASYAPIDTNGGFVKGVIGSILSTPLNLIGNFGKMFNTATYADVSAEPDPFAVAQYGYPSDYTFASDPEQYWNDNCDNNASDAYVKNNTWNKEALANLDPNTNMPINNTVNECLLLKETIGAAGGIFDTSNLTTDDLSGVPAQ